MTIRWGVTTTNLDDRLLRHWEKSQHRQQVLRTRLGSSSLPVERFEAWALELLGEALSPRDREEDCKLALVDTIGLEADDR